MAAAESAGITAEELPAAADAGATLGEPAEQQEVGEDVLGGRPRRG